MVYPNYLLVVINTIPRSNNASTVEGATLTHVCPGNQEKTAICTETGHWEPNSCSICAENAKSSGTFLCQPINSITVSCVIGIIIMMIKLFCRHKSKRKHCCGFLNNCACCDFNFVLHSWPSMWTLLSKDNHKNGGNISSFWTETELLSFAMVMYSSNLMNRSST